MNFYEKVKQGENLKLIETQLSMTPPPLPNKNPKQTKTIMAQPLSVLFVVPNKEKFQDMIKPCGWYIPTLSFAYDNFIDAGLNITFCSPRGGKTQVVSRI